MFEDLAEQMRQDERSQSSPWERALLWVVVLLLSIVVFAGLYLGVRALS